MKNPPRHLLLVVLLLLLTTASTRLHLHRTTSISDDLIKHDAESSRLHCVLSSPTPPTDARISLSLSPSHLPPIYPHLSVPGYKCPIALSDLPAIFSSRGIFDYSVHIRSEQNILFAGDSIMQQFAQGFYSAVSDPETEHVILRAFINGIEPALSGLHVCSSIVAPIYAGAAVGYHRMLDLPSLSELKDYVNCKKEGGWSWSDVAILVNHTYGGSERTGSPPLVRANSSHDSPHTTWYRSLLPPLGGAPRTVGNFDAVILRPPGPGWISLRSITRERIIDSISLLHALFGVETVILNTLPFNNNVLTRVDWEELCEVNVMIADLARGWSVVEGKKTGVKFLLVQDFSGFTNRILWRNAQHLGYNMSEDGDFNQSIWEKNAHKYLLHRLEVKSWKYNPAIPMVCNNMPMCTSSMTTSDEDGSLNRDYEVTCVTNSTSPNDQCFFNRFSRDGMHWCVETLGPRYFAAVACLLGCVYNGHTKDEYTSGWNDAIDETAVMEGVRQCERECNERFMTLRPVDEPWMNNDTVVYSKSNYVSSKRYNHAVGN